MFQSTPPSGSDNIINRFLFSYQSSIHDPRVGATRPKDQVSLGILVSIHAPEWGATMCGFALLYYAPFQSTPPSGDDTRAVRSSFMSPRFNPRPRVGTTRMRLLTGHLPAFHPRPPSGERPAGPIVVGPAWCFIHAPRWGSDNVCFIGVDIAIVSIHPPEWERPGAVVHTEAPQSFNPRPPSGSDVPDR
jgi:hypothetical protein